jgi:hypothetical protein
MWRIAFGLRSFRLRNTGLGSANLAHQHSILGRQAGAARTRLSCAKPSVSSWSRRMVATAGPLNRRPAAQSSSARARFSVATSVAKTCARSWNSTRYGACLQV